MNELFDSNGFAKETADIVFYTYIKKGDEYVFNGGENTVIFKGITIPPNVTIEAPPMSIPEGNNLFWIDEDNRWVVDEDHIGTTIYFTDTGDTSIITKRGPIPDGWTTTPYPGKDYQWSKITNSWVLNPEAEYNNKVQTKIKDRQQLLDKVLNLINKCDMLIAAGVNVDSHTAIKQKYQKQLKELYEINPELTPEIALPEITEFVL